MAAWMFRDTAGAARKVREAWFRNSLGVPTKVKEGWFRDVAGVPRRFFLAPATYTFNGPNVSGTGDGGSGPLYSIAPYPVAPRGTLTVTFGTPLVSIIGIHFSKAAGAGDQGLWITTSTPGPVADFENLRPYINGTLCTLNGNPMSPTDYIGAGFGGYYYVTGTFNNIAVQQNTNYSLEFK